MSEERRNDWNEITKEELERLDRKLSNRQIMDLFGITEAQLSSKKRGFGLSKINYWLYRPVVVGNVIEVVYDDESETRGCTIRADFGKTFGVHQCARLDKGIYSEEMEAGEQILGRFACDKPGTPDEKVLEVRVLGVPTSDGMILIYPEVPVPKGTMVP